MFPEKLVSSVPINLEVQTSQKAVCMYSLDSSAKQIFGNVTGYTRFVKSGVSLSEGEHNFEVSCADKMYNLKTKSRTITIDTLNGPKLVEPKKIYTDSNVKSYELTFSEDTVCKQSTEQKTAAEFENMATLPGTALTRTFTPTNLEIGENTFYIYCEKEGEIYSNLLPVIFDPNPPRLSNLKFVNNGIESDYVGSKTSLNFAVSVEAVIPVKTYVAELKFANSSVFGNFSSNTGSLSGNMESATEIIIYGINEIGKKSNVLNKIIKIDFEPPIVNFVSLGTKRDINCVDQASGCARTLYGFSQSAFNCIPTLEYNRNNSIEIKDNRYLCAKGIDNAGNEVVEIQTLSAGFITEDDSSEFLFNDTTEDNLTEDESEEEIKEDLSDEFTQSGTNKPTGGDDNTLIIVALAFVIVGGLGGGGYYSYQKGYLDKQLLKFGIDRKPKGVVKNDINVVSNTKQTNKKENFSVSNPITKDKKSEEKTKYDRNLKKLNTFLEDTLSKGSDVFDKFDKVDKGKVEGYEDTLIKGGKGKSKSKNFNEYKSKSDRDGENDASSIENDAEEFENYLKKKKTNNKKE